MSAGHPTNVRDLYRTLSEAEREMLILRWVNEMDPREIERRLGLEPGTVMPLVIRIRDRANAAVSHWHG